MDRKLSSGFKKTKSSKVSDTMDKNSIILSCEHWTNLLKNILSPRIHEHFLLLMKKSYEYSYQYYNQESKIVKTDDVKTYAIKIFQSWIKLIPKWGIDEISFQMKKLKDKYPDMQQLIDQVLKYNLSVIAMTRNGNKSSVELKQLTPSKFIHESFKDAASIGLNHSFLFIPYENVIDKQKAHFQSNQEIAKSIDSTIMRLLPLKDLSEIIENENISNSEKKEHQKTVIFMENTKKKSKDKSKIKSTSKTKTQDLDEDDDGLKSTFGKSLDFSKSTTVDFDMSSGTNISSGSNISSGTNMSSNTTFNQTSEKNDTVDYSSNRRSSVESHGGYVRSREPSFEDFDKSSIKSTKLNLDFSTTFEGMKKSPSQELLNREIYPKLYKSQQKTPSPPNRSLSNSPPPVSNLKKSYDHIPVNDNIHAKKELSIPVMELESKSDEIESKNKLMTELQALEKLNSQIESKRKSFDKEISLDKEHSIDK